MVTENILNDNSVQIRVDLATGNTDQVDRHFDAITERTRTLEQRAKTFVDTVSRGQANIYVPGTYDRMVQQMKDVEDFHKRIGVQSENIVEKINYQTGAVTASQKSNNRDSQRQAQEQLSAIEKIRQEEEKRLRLQSQISRHVESVTSNYITSPGANVGAQERLQYESFAGARGSLRESFGEGLGIQNRQNEVRDRLAQLREVEPDVESRAGEFASNDRRKIAVAARRDYNDLTKEIRALEREAKRLDRELKQHNKTYQTVIKDFADNFGDFDATIRGVSTGDISERFRDSEASQQYLSGEIDMDTLLETISTQLARTQFGQETDTTLGERAEREAIRQEEENARQEAIRAQEALIREQAGAQERIQREAAQRLGSIPDIYR